MTEGVVAVVPRAVDVEAEPVAKVVLGAPASPWFRRVKDNTDEAFAFYCKVREQKNLPTYVREETDATNAWLGPDPSLEALRAFHE